MRQHHIIAGHDRSDGGLITSLLEMCFAGNCGIDVTLPEHVDAIPYLFNESLGWLLEVDELLCEPYYVLLLIIKFLLLLLVLLKLNLILLYQLL